MIQAIASRGENEGKPDRPKSESPGIRGFRAAGNRTRTGGSQLGKLTPGPLLLAVVGDPASEHAKNTHTRNRARSGAAPGMFAGKRSRGKGEGKPR